MKRFAIPLLIATLPMAAMATTNNLPPKEVEWKFDGVRGKFDKPSVQRGLQVYREVCSSCHGLNRVAFRSLEGAGFSPDEVKALAAEYTVQDGPNDDGEMYDRPGRPSDKFPSPFANEKAARASNNGAYPPDQSLLIKAREDGANYIYSLLTGYGDAPAYHCAQVDDGKCVAFEKVSAEDAKAEIDAKKKAEEAAPNLPAGSLPEPTGVTVGQLFFCSDIEHKEEVKDGKTVTFDECRELGKGMHYNPYFPGKQIAMAAPLSADQVTYQDGTKATLDQEAKDIVSFLQWAAEPEMEQRKRMGVKVMIYLLIMTGFFYVAKKRIWSNLDH